MEIRQLETFVCVARNLSFSRAAEEVNLSQPTISTHISSLEDYLGVQLLVRNTKEVSITRAGEDFLIVAQKMLSIRDQALHDVKCNEYNACGNISILSSTIPAQHLLPELSAAFQEQYPNVIFRVEHADSRTVEQSMSAFRYDFGFMGTAPDDSRFVHYPVCEDELVLVVPNDTVINNMSIHEGFAGFITEVPFITRGSGSGTRTEIESIFSKIGVDVRKLRIAAYFSDNHSILNAVSKGMGVSLISRVAAALYAQAGLLKAIDLDSSLFSRQIYIVHNKELFLSPIQQLFCDHARNFYRNGGGH
ncbi:MAG: LysR family transcriptional regulator [Treponema sp.]|jgi:DNA-binding transcriptional LysR family regulator|nr:LysR family transcriptional regulator [Treponema sp.]